MAAIVAAFADQIAAAGWQRSNESQALEKYLHATTHDYNS